jgi:hypothetical protein
MQANNDPKWTDDAAFWNEAWADMDKRLNEEPKSRKAVLVWWRRYGWLLGLILLVTAVETTAAMAYLSQEEKTEQQPTPYQTPVTPVTPATPVDKTPEVIASNDVDVANQEPTATASAEDKVVVTKSAPSPVVPVATTASVVTDTPPNPTSATSPSTTSTTNNEAITLGEPPSNFPPTSTIIPSSSEALEQTPPVFTPSTKEIPAALTSLTRASIAPITFAQNLSTTQLDAVIGKPKLVSRLYLDAGTSYGFKSNKVGYYAGLQYSLPLSKRVSIPLGLRFRRDYHQFVELAESGTPARYLDIGNSTTASAPDTILFEFTSENLNEVATTSFEGRIGVDYSVTPRLRIGASLAVNYLQAAIARVSPQYQQEFAADQNRLLNADADITLVSGLSFFSEDASAVDQATPLASGNGAPSNFPNFNPWVAHAGMNLSYDLTNRLSFTLSGRRLLAQPDQSKVIGLQRGQLQIGARWRLK